MALNNISNEKITHILLIMTLTMSGYTTFTNTQVDDDRLSELDNKLNIIRTVEDVNNKLDNVLYHMNLKVATNSFEIKVINDKLDDLENGIDRLNDKINHIEERVRIIESTP